MSQSFQPNNPKLPAGSGPGSDRPKTPEFPSHGEPWSPVSTSTIRWCVIIGTVALVLGPVLFQIAPKEIARWIVAGAQVKHEVGDDKSASEKIERALQWDSECPEAHVLKAVIEADRLFKKGDYEEALKLTDKIAEEYPSDKSLENLRNRLFEALGQFDKLVVYYEKQLRSAGSVPPREKISLLNQAAYYHALADKDLDRGLAEINDALQFVERSAALYDTRGFVLYKMGRYDDALRDLEVSVQSVEDDYQRAQRDRKGLRTVREREFQAALNELKKAVAVIRYHRGLILEKLDQNEKAAEDYERVRELGFEPDEKLY
jgi:tetratricopeptide (TPR) repeat protein